MGVINLSILIKKIMGKISGAGFIKDTSYASSSKGGTIKVDSTYATDITSGGKLKAKEITAEAYAEANDAAFISKATLDNVLAAQPAPAAGLTFTEIFSGAYTTGDQAFTYPTGKTIADYSGMVVVAQNSDDFEMAWIPKEVLSIPTYFVQLKLGTFYNDNTDRYIKVKIAKDGTAMTGGANAGSVKIAKVYVF